jgi:hypothetical protein
MPPVRVTSIAEVDEHAARMKKAAADCADALASLQSKGFDLLKHLRFEQFAEHPFRAGERVTLAEHLNQLFTNLVTFEGARRIFQRVPAVKELDLKLGATPGGLDIMDHTGLMVVAECFAGNPFRRDPRKKMTKIAADIQSVGSHPALNKFVFFYHPLEAVGQRVELQTRPDVEVWCLEVGK